VIIDAHVHVHRPEVAACREEYCGRELYFRALYSEPKVRMATMEELIRDMDEDGVACSVICGFAWRDAGLCRDDNDYVMEAVRRYPDRFIGLAVVNPMAGQEAVREMERCAQGGLRGVGELMPDGQSYELDDLAVMRPIIGER